MKSVKSWLLLALFAPVSLLAQKEDKEKDKDKDKEKNEVQQIIITRSGDKKDKVVVEINNDKITINGKPVEDFKEGDIKVMMKNLKDVESLTFSTRPGTGMKNWNNNNNVRVMTATSNRAMLGVSTEEDEKGAKVNDVTEESAAAKAGLKEGDIITRIDEDKIKNPDELTAAIRKHKPGDKVTITWLRDNKEQKATAELSKWKGMDMWGGNGGVQEFRMDEFNQRLQEMMPKMQELQKMKEYNSQSFGPGWSWNGSGPKLGISVQDTDDGKGVKVINVDEESTAAKAGIKEDDVITEIDGKAVNGTDEVVKIIRESKDKISINVKLQRGGKSQSMDVKMPRKLKSADL